MPRRCKPVPLAFVSIRRFAKCAQAPCNNKKVNTLSWGKSRCTYNSYAISMIPSGGASLLCCERRKLVKSRDQCFLRNAFVLAI